MRLRTLSTLLLLIYSSCFGANFAETGDFVFSIDTYLRQDIVGFRNVADLESRRRGDDDATIYLGIDYSFGFGLAYKNNGPKFYLKLERNGPFDYSAPLFVHNTLINTAGSIQKYQKSQLFPQIEEFWLDIPLSAFRFKSGLYTYGVGNGFSLNGSYENYGFTLTKESENTTWNLYYCRPDLVYKNRLGPKIVQEEEQGILHEHNSANFLSTDIQFKMQNASFQPYIGILTDNTSSGKRNNTFAAPIKKDILGTLGLAHNFNYNNLSLDIELAHNFGKAESADSNFEDIHHAGYLIYTGLEYDTKKFTPFLRLLIASGNKVTLDNALNQDTRLSSSKNRAFSYYSPLNHNLSDSITTPNVDMLPIVAMGGGYGLNYGIRRPGTFVAGDFENLAMPSIGFDFKPTEKLTLGFYEYYLRAFEKPVGTLNSQARFLSQDVGFESDIFIDYQISKNVLISILGGYFFPGKYYKELRDDASGSLLSPFVRAGPDADPAYQIELAIETKF